MVGAYAWDPNGYLVPSISKGIAWVFEDVSGSWTETAQLQLPASAAASIWEFGMSVALSGDGSTILVAGLQEQDILNDWECIPGDVAVYTEPAGGWSGVVAPATYLTPPTSPPPSNDCENNAHVALSDDGSTAASSIDGDSVYLEPAGGWSSEAAVGPSTTLEPPSVPSGQTLVTTDVGLPIAISGDGSTVAATFLVGGGAVGGSAVATYERPGSSWSTPTGTVDPDALLEDPYAAYDPVDVPNGLPYTNMGGPATYSNLLSNNLLGETLALDEDGNALVAGNAQQCITPSPYPYCEPYSPTGYYPNEPNANYEVGAADVFDLTASGWVASANLQSTDAEGGDLAGTSVGISADGTEVIVGAPSREAPGTIGYGSGAAFVYQQMADGSWSEIEDLNPAGLNEDGDLGYTVALPGNGSTAFVSDPYFGSRDGTAGLPSASASRMDGEVAAARMDGEVLAVPGAAVARIVTKTPHNHLDPGSTVTVSGSNFAGKSFTFDGKPLRLIRLASTRATFELPESAYTGELVISASATPIGSGLLLKVTGPIVTGMSTRHAKVGQRVTIFGRFLSAVTKLCPEKDQVTTKIVARSPTSITFIVPYVVPSERSGRIELFTPVSSVLSPTLKIT